ncbi:MAG: HAMP domain-containing histidine kinase, partial [Magnetococcales bacterium]|nr:HAMP domain-containing histidine kinase [Magnetococcales bacterium]
MKIWRLTRLLLWRIGRLRHTVPLTVQALIITGAAGAFFWFFQDALHARRMESLVQNHLLLEMRRDAQIDWIQLDERLRNQERVVRWLVERAEFAKAFNQRDAAGWMEEEPQEDLSREPSETTLVWFPARRIARELGYAVHALLADGTGRARAFVTARGKPQPGLSLQPFIDACLAHEAKSAVRYDQGLPHFLTCADLRHGDGRAKALLVLIAPLDDDFLQSFHAERYQDGILVFLDEAGERVMASSRPERIPARTLLSSLHADHLIFGKEIGAESYSAAIFLRFVGLLPKERLDALTSNLVGEGRSEWAAGLFLLIALFVGIIYWLGRMMRLVTKKMVAFARQRLNLTLTAAGPGNALQQFMDQFEILTLEIEEARAREAEASERLARSNQALESSLTLLKRTHSQLLSSEKMTALGGLVAGVAHEINTPVGIGVTAASFLENRTRDCRTRYDAGTLARADLEGYLQDASESSAMILSNLMRAAELVRSFKQVAVDTSSEACRSFDFATLIQQTLQSLHPRLKKTPHQIEVICPEGLTHFGRPDVFSQIVTNFVINSLLHGFADDRAGRITITVESRGDQILLRYGDDGLGMSDEAQKRIFEPFFTTARHKGGSGLGMHI